MLSKTEIEFLKNPESFDAGYSRVMRHRIKTKAENFRAQIALMQGCGALEGNGLNVTENCNGVTEFSNDNQSLNRVAFLERRELMVRSPRFEPGSSAWQADVLDQTRLRPHIHDFWLSSYQWS